MLARPVTARELVPSTPARRRHPWPFRAHDERRGQPGVDLEVGGAVGAGLRGDDDGLLASTVELGAGWPRRAGSLS